MQRLRLTFTRGEPVKYISHLDLLRLWERALRRARLPVAYSEGFNPHPRFALAMALAVGVTSEAELLDLYLAERREPPTVRARLAPQLPPGIAVEGVEEVALEGPSAQSQIRWAEYVVAVATEWAKPQVQAAVDALLAAESLPRVRLREGKPRPYDLRPLVQRLWLIDSDAGRCRLGMRLRAEGGATGRPEEVARALGFEDVVAIHRTRLVLEGDERVNV